MDKNVICGTAEVERIAAGIRAQATPRQWKRRLPVGAEPIPGGVHFRVWAPRWHDVFVEVSSSTAHNGRADITAPLEPEGDGYFSGLVPGAAAGMRYRFRLGSGLFPDPASRFQPEAPHGPSQIIDPAAFRWTDENWRGLSGEGQVIYELHVGTFTREGTWRAALEQLPELQKLGITVLEIMPVAEFPGRFGWGYDGVNLFAPTRLYGEPDDFRTFVARAHELGLGVILDVVYNHFGPDGNYLPEFSEHYFTRRYQNEWGEAINFDGEQSGPVREFILANAGYWIDEFHLDGLRLDATQQIFDASEDNIIAAIARRVREAAEGRGTWIVAENEPQEMKLVRPAEAGGFGLDALWNDDFHHAAMVAATGHSEAYYSDYAGAPQEFISCVKWGCLFQGQLYRWQKNGRGTPGLDIPPARFVTFLQNHDQVANSLRGQRLHTLTTPGRFKALTTLLLLGPNTPMLFQGQEFAASTPFFYFADHNEELTRMVAEGRRKFLRQFRTLNCPEVDEYFTHPGAEEVFTRCKLDFIDRERHADVYELHRALLQLRRDDAVFSRPRKGGVDGAVLGAEAFVLRFFGEGGDDRLLFVNLGPDLHLTRAPEPLLAPPHGKRWSILFSTESPYFGGCGTPPVETEEGWCIPGHSAVVLCPERSAT